MRINRDAVGFNLLVIGGLIDVYFRRKIARLSRQRFGFSYTMYSVENFC